MANPAPRFAFHSRSKRASAPLAASRRRRAGSHIQRLAAVELHPGADLAWLRGGGKSEEIAGLAFVRARAGTYRLRERERDRWPGALSRRDADHAGHVGVLDEHVEQGVAAGVGQFADRARLDREPRDAGFGGPPRRRRPGGEAILYEGW